MYYTAGQCLLSIHILDLKCLILGSFWLKHFSIQFESWQGQRNSSLLKTIMTRSRAHPASYSVGSGALSPGVNTSDMRPTTQPASSAKVKNEWGYTSPPPVWPHGICRDNITFILFTPVSIQQLIFKMLIWWVEWGILRVAAWGGCLAGFSFVIVITVHTLYLWVLLYSICMWWRARERDCMYVCVRKWT